MASGAAATNGAGVRLRLLDTLGGRAGRGRLGEGGDWRCKGGQQESILDPALHVRPPNYAAIMAVQQYLAHGRET